MPQLFPRKTFTNKDCGLITIHNIITAGIDFFMCEKMSYPTAGSQLGISITSRVYMYIYMVDHVFLPFMTMYKTISHVFLNIYILYLIHIMSCCTF